MFQLPDDRIESRSNELASQVIGAAIEVHRHMGPGLLESAYENCLCHELSLRGLRFEQQVMQPLEYKGRFMDNGFRLDLVVAGMLVVELKAVEKLSAIHEAQVLTYLRFSQCYLGLLLNFNELRLKDGIRRIINPAAGHNLDLLKL